MHVFNYIYTDTIILTTSMPKYVVPKKKKKRSTQINVNIMIFCGQL